MATTRSRLLLLPSLYRATRIAMRPGGPGLGERIAAVPRLLRETRAGRYAGPTAMRLALIAAALAYVVSPVDLVPEGALLLLGLADDAVVLGWLAAVLVTETESFLTWEEQQLVPVAVTVPGAYPHSH